MRSAESPSSGLVIESFLVAGAICSVPAALISVGERSVVTVFVFVAVAGLHVMMFGIPAFWLLWWVKRANGFSCAVAGLLVATLPYAIVFAPGMSGPGVNHVKTSIQLALSGAAIGAVFWLYLTRRMGSSKSGLVTVSGSGRPRTGPVPFPARISNSELFAWLRRGAGGHAYLEEVFRQARPGFEARKVRDLSIDVAADAATSNRYLLRIRNTGMRTFNDLRIHYEPLLLFAEHFGLDSTHMPDDVAYAHGEPLILDALRAGETVVIAKSGYASADRYDGPPEAALDLEYRIGNRKVGRDDKHWVQATVCLPARSRSEQPVGCRKA
jgi:hypothetical protein